MADTSALISLERIVTDFLFGYEKSTERYAIMLRHACLCYQDFNLYDGEIQTSAKVTINPFLKCIELPDDCQKVIDISTPNKGGWWSFTQNDNIVNTTTTVGGVETRDEAQGEGAKMDVGVFTGYGATGGYNNFKCTVDMAARRIYTDSAYTANDYIVLVYVSSGINANGETKVPSFLIPLFDAYLLWKETIIDMNLAKLHQQRYNQYWQEKMKVRSLINAMSKDMWLDIFASGYSQAPRR